MTGVRVQVAVGIAMLAAIGVIISIASTRGSGRAEQPPSSTPLRIMLPRDERAAARRNEVRARVAGACDCEHGAEHGQRQHSGSDQQSHARHLQPDQRPNAEAISS